MSQSSVAVNRAQSARGLLVWAGLPVITAVYLTFSVWDTSAASLAYSQVAYLIAPSLFATFSSAAAWASATRTTEHRVWSLLSVAAWALFASEAAISYGAITDGLSPWWGVFFDVVNASAVAMFLGAAVVASGLSKVGRLRALRLTIDSVALATITFAFFVRFLESSPGYGGGIDSVSLRVAAYLTIAVGTLAIDLAVGGFAAETRNVWSMELTAGLAVFAVAVALWALSGVPVSPAATEVGTLTLVASLAFLVAYYLLFIAAFFHVLRTGSPGRPATMRSWTMSQSAAPGIAVSSALLAGIVWLGYSLITTPADGPTKFVSLGSLLVVVFAMVAHTILESEETARLIKRSKVDHVSGMPGPGALAEGLAPLIEEARISGRLCVVMVVDSDDFARINAAKGFRYGDRLLKDIARSITRVVGSSRAVYRLSGDEFLVAGSVDDARAAGLLARAILSAVRVTGTADALTVSIGYVLCPQDGETQEDLIRKADRAKVWVKRHGKNQAVAYEDRLGDALGIEQRLSDDEDTRRTMVRALCSATDARDPANRHHSRNVASLARLMAEDYGLDDEHVRRVEMAAVLHDVGKIALPDQMLGGKTLSIRERRSSREHSALGERLTEPLGIKGVSSWIRAHHERWDGNGYPDGATGEEIPLEARIIALADAYDSMTAGTRYGAPLSKAGALQEIDLGIGSRFDPELAERFIRLVATTGALGWSDDWEGVG